MERLPIKFEETVLSEHGADWCNRHNRYEDFNYENPQPVDEYKIAAIGLEAMKSFCNTSLEINPQKSCYETIKQHLDFREVSKNEIGFEIDESKDLFEIQCYENTPIGFKLFYSQDFCTCIFKVIKEIYK